jgi:DNA-binding beta-propeller fold protein YncE
MRSYSLMLLATGLVAIAATACGGGTGDPSATGVGSIDERAASTSQAVEDDSKVGLIGDLRAKPTLTGSTVPANGDVNPYGITFVPSGFPSGGLLRPGDVVVANFNNSANLQGTGTTIVRVNPNAAPSLFFADEAAPGFSTALGVLRRGFVIVGAVPSADGSGVCTPDANGRPTNVGQGALLVIDRAGKLVNTLTSPTLLDGPWDLTVEDLGSRARVFVSNVLSGTVTRVDLRVGKHDVSVEGETQIASGYTHRCDPASFVVGPTGLALDPESDVLYVAATGDNAIYAVENARGASADHGPGKLVVSDRTHFHGPLGLVRTRTGHFISAQGDAVNPDPKHPSEIVDSSGAGKFVAEFSIDPAPGSAFGLALDGSGERFAAVDDGLNVVDVWNLR